MTERARQSPPTGDLDSDTGLLLFNCSPERQCGAWSFLARRLARTKRGQCQRRLNKGGEWPAPGRRRYANGLKAMESCGDFPHRNVQQCVSGVSVVFLQALYVSCPLGLNI